MAIAKDGTGSKASRSSDAQADAQIERANSTSAMFLGTTRGYSWMTGDPNWTPAPRSNPSANAPTARDGPQHQNRVQVRRGGNAVQQERSKSTSNSPQIANMAMPSQSQSGSKALSPPLTPNPDPQTRDDILGQARDNVNGWKRSQAATDSSPKRRRVEDASHNANFPQQQANDTRAQPGHGVGLGLGLSLVQQDRANITPRSALVEAQTQAQPQAVQADAADIIYHRLQLQQIRSPALVQSPNYSNAPMPPPPPIASAALSNRRASGSPATQQAPWGLGPRQSLSQSPNMGHWQAQSAPLPPPGPNNVLRSNSPPREIVMRGLQQFLFVDVFSLHAPYEREGCQSILEAYIASRGGLGTLGPTERLRLQVLQTAVAENDWLFLFLHHIVSQQHLNPGFVPSAIAATPNFQAAANTINTVLGSPQLHDPGMMTFFAAFPCQLGLSLSFNPTKDDGLTYLSQFMPELPQLWQNLESECRQRQYPPTIPEMAGYLKVLSPMLMRIFFTAARRTAWPCSPEQESSPEMARIVAEADITFAGARSTFLYQFQHYQPNDEIQEYLKLQRIFHRLRHNQPNQNQFDPLQQRQGQPIRRLPGVAPKDHIQRALVMQAQPQIQRQQGQQRQIGPVQQQCVVTERSVQFNSNAVPTSNLQMATVRPSSRQLLEQSIPLSTTIPSPRQPPVGIPGLSSPAGNQGSPSGGSLAPTHFSGQAMSGNIVASRGTGQQALPAAGRFVPALNDPLPPQPALPNPQMSALHQAHLREPILMQDPDTFDESAPCNFYQMVSYYLLPPKRLASDSPVQEWKFDLHEGEYEHIALTMPSSIEGQRSTRVLAEGSHQYRLRCSKMPPSPQSIKVKDWTVSNTTFPANMYMIINGHDLEVRRKLHHGKDLPIDITDYLKSGPNVLEILLNLGPDDLDASNYVLAIETVGVKSGETIIEECRRREREAEVVLSAIKNSLNGAGAVVNNDDDELIMVSGNVTIDLVDPIALNTTLTIPVRGLNCTHWSCFDLPTFLQSRMFPDQGISAVDTWICPICRGDARPQSLIVDGFVLKVRQKLDQDGKQRVRAIVVEADGSWRPRPEKVKEGGPSSQSKQTILSAPSPQGSPVQQPSAITNALVALPSSTSEPKLTAKRPIEIVDLGSDTD
ncbi:hypothetical protein FKW77_002823 [Venturia effusa]|uniref:SP-RING-type domain-containing protein n=1 Tax=Venturia effusa TaxID=50376 RepID=A0A517L523_9PEZI|nr:hypothetical protein FKW77_002823 [Venturia effusa]